MTKLSIIEFNKKLKEKNVNMAMCVECKENIEPAEAYHCKHGINYHIFCYDTSAETHAIKRYNKDIQSDKKKLERLLEKKNKKDWQEEEIKKLTEKLEDYKEYTDKCPCNFHLTNVSERVIRRELEIKNAVYAYEEFLQERYTTRL